MVYKFITSMNSEIIRPGLQCTKDFKRDFKTGRLDIKFRKMTIGAQRTVTSL